MIDSSGHFGFCPGYGIQVRVDGTDAQPRESARCQDLIDSCRYCGIDEGIALSPLMLLFQCPVVKRAVTTKSASIRYTPAITAESGFGRVVFNRGASVEYIVLRKEKGITVPVIRASTSHHIHGTARRPPILCGEPIIHNLELLHDFRRQFGAAGSIKFIVIAETVQGDAVAAGAQTAGGETAGSFSGATANRGGRSGCDTRRQQHEIQSISRSNGRFFDELLVNKGDKAGL